MIEEIQSVMQGKTALPIHGRERLIFSGSDRTRYLNGQTTNDVGKLKPGHALHATVCTAKGKMHGEIMITNDGERLLVDFPDSLSETLTMRLEKYIIADDVEIQPPQERKSGYHLMTERAPDVPQDVECYTSTRFQRPGYDLWLPESSRPNFPVAGTDISEWIRILCGIPRWGTDISENNMPPEAYPELHTISYRKGCYIGQEVIARIKSIGQVKKLLCLLQGTQPPAALPVEVIRENRKVGLITSCQHTPDQDGKYLALGMIQTDHSEPATEYEVAGCIWWSIRRCN
ncbi:MAG: hypothetical protein AAF649_02280 [Verrucomicrobiota bacterium]